MYKPAIIHRNGVGMTGGKEREGKEIVGRVRRLLRDIMRVFFFSRCVVISRPRDVLYCTISLPKEPSS